MPRFNVVRPVIRMVMLSLVVVSTAAGQDNPVYVNDSPAALAALRQAEDQLRDNPGEAIRLFQTLLDEYPMKLVPVTEGTTDQFVSVRQRVLRNLRSADALLERYRLVATPQAVRMIESGQLERLAVTRSLTEPGLTALLTLAQERVESAHFDAALLWLDQAVEHPDCHGRAAAHAWYMTAVAAHYRGDTAAAQQARQALTQLGEPAPQLLEELDRLVLNNGAPPAAVGHTVLSRTSPDAVRDLIAQPIWTQQLEQSLLFRRHVEQSIPETRHSPVLDQRRREADLMTAAATVCGDVVYVNEGFRVSAYDRYMGDVRWSYLDSPSLSMLDRDTDPPLDLSVIAISGSALVTFTGHAHSDQRSGSGAVLCLDRHTGERRWDVSLDGIGGGDDMNDLYPHGSPIIADGTVFLLARKVSAQRLASTYAVALDLGTGRMRWARYLTSSGGLHRSGRPISMPTYKDGWLYVATSIGAMARLDSTTGEITWMRRFGVPINVPFQDQARRPWEFSSPVVTTFGVLAIQPDQRRIVQLDQRSGDVLQTFDAAPGEPWGEVHYLLADDKRVYAVGRDIRAFAIDHLERAVWTLPPPATSRVDDRINLPNDPMQRLDLRGRVQVTDGLLVVPSLQGALFVDAETGQITHQLPVEGGNPVLVDAQLFYTGSDRLDAYMSFERAQEMLRRRIAGQPDDPRPALSLVRLGVRVGDLGLALSAAELAHHAIQMHPDPRYGRASQRELFELLLHIDHQQLAAVPGQAEALFVLIDAAAQGPAERVAATLARGDWLAGGDPGGRDGAGRDVGAAVEAYQRLLGDADLATVAVPAQPGAGPGAGDEGVVRDAAHVAAARLRVLIAERGGRVYAAQADYARRQLDALVGAETAAMAMAGTGADAQLGGAAVGLDVVDELEALGKAYPFAPAGVAATRLAAGACGDARAAVAMLLSHARLIDGGIEPQQRSSATGDAAAHRDGAVRDGAVLVAAAQQVCAAAGWAATAERLGAAVQQRNAAGQRAGGWSRAAAGLAQLGEDAGLVRELAGALVPLAGDGSGDGLWAGDGQRFVTAMGTVISQHAVADVVGGTGGDGGQDQARWRLDVGEPASGVLWQDGSRVLVWLSSEPTEARAVLLDAHDGSVRWTTPRLEALFGDPLHAMIRATELNEQMPGGEAFDPSQTLALTAGGRLVLVRRIGQVAAFELDGDGAAAWTLAETLDQVHHAALSETSLVLMGVQRSRSGRERTTAAMVVIDPATGRVVRRYTEVLDNEPAVWMVAGPLGRVVYGNGAGIEAVDVWTGRRAWTNRSYVAGESLAAWTAGDAVVFQERSRQLRSVSMEHGRLSESFDGPLRADAWDPYDLQDVVAVGEAVFALYPRRVVRYALDGRIVGQDVVSDDRDYRWLIPTADGLLVISASSSQTLRPDESGRRLQYMYRVYRLSPTCKLVGEALDLPPQFARIETVRAMDGALLLSLDEPVTRVVPMPVGVDGP